MSCQSCPCFLKDVKQIALLLFDERHSRGISSVTWSMLQTPFGLSVSSSLTVSTTVAPTLRIIAYVIISLFVCCKLVPLITYPWKIPGHPTISRGAISSQPQGALKLTKWHVLTYRKCGRQSSSVYFTATFKGLGATLYLQGSAASTADARSHFFGGACGEYAPTFSLMILRANACKVFLGKVMWWCVFELWTNDQARIPKPCDLRCIVMIKANESSRKQYMCRLGATDLYAHSDE